MDLKVNVATLLKQAVGQGERYQIASAEGPVKGEVKLVRTPRSILATGRLDTASLCQCSRCLSEFSQPLSLELEEEFYPTVDIGTGRRLPPPPDPDALTIDEHQDLDLSEAVRQCALTAMPMKPLCSTQCRGLCPQCGANLNAGPCSCSTASDPRWENLRTLTTTATSRKRKD